MRATIPRTDLPKPGEGILDLEATIETITDEGLRSCSTNLLPVGSVLYSTRATLLVTRLRYWTKRANGNKSGFNLTSSGPVNSEPTLYNRYLAYAVHFFTPDISLTCRVDNLQGSLPFVADQLALGARVPFPNF